MKHKQFPRKLGQNYCIHSGVFYLLRVEILRVEFTYITAYPIQYSLCFQGHCVVVFNEDGQFVRRIGCENITNFPNGIDISDAGDVLVGDSHGNRFHVAVFQREGSLIGEFECPYVKVSRCCGLKITSEGYVVTLAKNNHHVLVLNTLYIA